MNRMVHKLVHFRDLKPGDAPNLANGSHVLGTYTSEAEALSTIRRVQDKPGFRDHPDGFRLFAIAVDRTYFSEGFVPGSCWPDAAIAGDPSPLTGDDSELGRWPEEDVRDPADDERLIASVTPEESVGWLWYLRHFKIAETSTHEFEDMGEKLIGLYSSRTEANRAMERLRDKPGFRDWPGGFRLNFGAPDGEPAFADGFGDPDEPEG